MVENALLLDYLLFVIFPLWIVTGLTDYALHRRTRIEENAGTRESLLHAMQLGEVGVPILFALFFDVNALIFSIMLAGLLLHEITALWDLTYASTRRYVSPLEQHVHSFMEVLPLTALLFMSLMYWGQFSALFGFGAEPARFALQVKPQPIPPPYLVMLFFCVGGFVVLPYAEELWRCLRAAARSRVGDDAKHMLRPSRAARRAGGCG